MSTRDGVGTTVEYQPQCFHSDGEFDSWDDIGFPTISKRIASARLALFKEVNPTTKTRCLRIRSEIEVFDLPPAATETASLASLGIHPPK